MVVNGDFVELPGPPYADCNPNNPPVGTGTCAGSIEFAVTCSTAASIKFKAEIIAVDGKSDSLFIQANGGTKITWHTGQRKSFAWSGNSPAVPMNSGRNQLLFHGREDNFKVKQFKIEDGSDVCAFS